MSILLEALRKSEAQRQLGTTPTLSSAAVQPDSGLANGNYWLPVAMALLVAVLISWAGIRQFRPAEVPARPDAGGTVITYADDSRPPAPQAGDDTAPSATTPLKNYRGEPSKVSPAEASELASDERAAEPLSDRDLPVKSFSRTGSQHPTESQEIPDQVPQSPAVHELAGGDGTAEVAGEKVRPFQGEVISYWQLPKSLREDMPELHISVLVFAEDPNDRFVLINGQRVRENEEVARDLVLEEIQRDRAIFTYRSYRFHVKS